MATGDDKDTNLSQSGYPIKNVNMTVPLPGDTAAINNSTNGGGANIFASIANIIQVGELYAYEIGTSNYCRYSLMKPNTASSTSFVLIANSPPGT